MQKKREEAYKPDVCFNTNIISIQYDNSQNDFCDEKVTFTIINLGVGTAKDIRVKHILIVIIINYVKIFLGSKTRLRK